MSLDRATVYAMGGRLWGGAGGLVTISLVGALLSPELQGYYFTFLGLLSLQAVLELGFPGVIQQFASHDWAEMEGEDSARRGRARHRLARLMRLALRWYAGLGLALTAGLGTFGSRYFQTFATAGVSPGEWRLVWWIACLATGIGALVTPVLALLEGMNRVESVYRARWLQSALSRAAGWLVLLSGGGLWTIPISRLTGAVAGLACLGRGQWRLLRELWQVPRALTLGTVSWRRELWPLQWRFGVSWLSGTLVFSLFSPVLFAFHGPLLAGQMGMTVSVMTAVSSLAFAVVATRMPQLAILAARREWGAMDSLSSRTGFWSLALVAAGALAFVATLFGIRAAGFQLGFRFLPVWETGLFCLAIVVQQLRFVLAAYLRAHKREPLAGLAAAEGVAALVLLTLLGRSYGSAGMVIGFAALSVAMTAPTLFIFRRCRAAWHDPQLTPTEAGA